MLHQPLLMAGPRALTAATLAVAALSAPIGAQPTPIPSECPPVLVQPVAIIYVDDSAPAIPPPTGNSWSRAYRDLQDALARCRSNPTQKFTIRVGQGTYKPDAGTGNRALSFELVPNGQLFGGFAGFGAPNPNLRNIETHVTTLSGNIGNQLVYTDNSYHVVTTPASDLGTYAFVEGFYVREGNADDSFAPHNSGGGFRVSSTRIRIHRCFILENRAVHGGGAWVEGLDNDARAVFIRCRFSANFADETGGGLHADKTFVDVLNCTFAANTASIAEPFSYGGGVFLAGPGIPNGDDDGGEDDGPPGENTPQDGDGPGFENAPNLLNCLFHGNIANYGGGSYQYNACPAVVTSCTFAYNHAEEFGGGMNNETGGMLRLSNTITAFNDDSTGQTADAQLYDPFLPFSTDVNFNCIKDIVSPPGVGNIGSDPLFRDPATSDFRLEYNSPCRDTGNDDLLHDDIYDLDVDANRIEPHARDLDDLSRLASTVDMGAYEFKDCDGDDIPDDVEIASGLASDVNGDRIPDDCQDCDGDGILDPIEIQQGLAQDCNRNGIPDICDIQSKFSQDCNENNIPDECEGCIIDLVCIFDLSGSMTSGNQFTEICSMLDALDADLASLGFDPRMDRYGILDEQPPTCTTGTVDTLSTAVPCNPGACGGVLDNFEDWGPATAVVAAYYPWRPGAKRVIITFSDEGACEGDPCTPTPGSDDRQSIDNAIVVCNQRTVRVFPVVGYVGEGDLPCSRTLADILATGTSGADFDSHNYGDSYIPIEPDLRDAILVGTPGFCDCNLSVEPPTPTVHDFLDAFFNGSRAADYNRDGSVDADDLVAFLAANSK